MKMKRILLALTTILISVFYAKATDPSIDVYIDNISYVSSRIMEFDIMMKAGGSTTSFQLRTFQAGLYVNPAWINGGTPVMQNVSTYSQMDGAGYNGSFQWDSTDNLINCSVNFDLIGPSTCKYTIVNSTPLNITRIRVTNDVDFDCIASPDIRFNYVPNLNPLRLRSTFSWREVGCTTNYEMFYPDRTYTGTATFNGETYTDVDADGMSPILPNGNVGFCSGQLIVTAAIEGFYDYNTGYMAADLMNCFVPHGNEDLMDTVYIDLYDSATASTLVQTFQAVMRTDGTINCFFPSNSILIGNSYWIAFRHRNTLQAWSASPILFSDRTEYDFTSAQNMTYGDNSIQIDNGQWAFFSGDISDAALGLVGLQDQVIESQDYGDMENAVYVTLTGYIPEDITGDGIVESSDYGLMENNVYFTRVIHRP